MIRVNSYGIVPFIQDNEQWKVLLILHKEGNHWGFPKGKGEQGEEGIDAARRELEEETGLHVLKFFSFPPHTEEYQFRRKGTAIVKSVTYFAALVGGTLNLQPEEIRDAKWLTIQEALALLSFKEARDILKQFSKLLEIS